MDKSAILLWKPKSSHSELWLENFRRKYH